MLPMFMVGCSNSNMKETDKQIMNIISKNVGSVEETVEESKFDNEKIHTNKYSTNANNNSIYEEINITHYESKDGFSIMLNLKTSEIKDFNSFLWIDDICEILGANMEVEHLFSTYINEYNNKLNEAFRNKSTDKKGNSSGSSMVEIPLKNGNKVLGIVKLYFDSNTAFVTFMIGVIE